MNTGWDDVWEAKNAAPKGPKPQSEGTITQTYAPRSTEPAKPLSRTAKVILWGVGILLVMVVINAIYPPPTHNELMRMKADTMIKEACYLAKNEPWRVPAANRYNVETNCRSAGYPVK